VNGNGTQHSKAMKITERFRRIADDIVQYQATWDEPLTYEKPFTVSFPLTPLDGGELLPYDATQVTRRSRCHSVPSARKTRRWPQTWRRASTVPRARCRIAAQASVARRWPAARRRAPAATVDAVGWRTRRCRQHGRRHDRALAAQRSAGISRVTAATCECGRGDPFLQLRTQPASAHRSADSPSVDAHLASIG
jgi:hypothetical protein